MNRQTAMKIFCVSCGQPSWVALRFCANCATALSSYPRRLVVETRLEPLGPARSIHVGNTPRIFALFGDLVVVGDDGHPIQYRGADAVEPEGGDALEDWVGRPLWTDAGDGTLQSPSEILAANRWLVARDAGDVRVMAAALSHSAAQPTRRQGYERALSTEDILDEVTGSTVAPRIGSIARLGERLAILCAEGGDQFLRIVDLDDQARECSWEPSFTDVFSELLPEGRWWIDRGAVQGGERLFACSERAVFIVAKTKNSQEYQHQFFEMPADAGDIVPGQATFIPQGVMVLTEQRGIRRPWLIDSNGPRQVEGPDDLEGIERDLSDGQVSIVGRTSTRRIRFDVNFRRFAGDLWNVRSIRQVDVEAPGGVVFRTDNINDPLLRFPGVEAVLPVSQAVTTNTRLTAAIEGPRIWLLIRASKGPQGFLQAFEWRSAE